MKTKYRDLQFNQYLFPPYLKRLTLCQSQLLFLIKNLREYFAILNCPLVQQKQPIVMTGCHRVIIQLTFPVSVVRIELIALNHL